MMITCTSKSSLTWYGMRHILIKQRNEISKDSIISRSINSKNLKTLCLIIFFARSSKDPSEIISFPPYPIIWGGGASLRCLERVPTVMVGIGMSAMGVITIVGMLRMCILQESRGPGPVSNVGILQPRRLVHIDCYCCRSAKVYSNMMQAGFMFVYGFLLLSNMVPFSSQMFLSALYLFILVTC